MQDIEKAMEALKMAAEFRSSGAIDDRDAMSLIDGDSVAILTAKVNAIIKVFMKDQPESVKQEFVDAWKAEYLDLAIRKQKAFKKMMMNAEFMEKNGIPTSMAAEIALGFDTIIEVATPLIEDTANRLCYDIL